MGRLLAEALALYRQADACRLVQNVQLAPMKALEELGDMLWKHFLELLFPLLPMSGLLRDTFPRLGVGMRQDQSKKLPLHDRSARGCKIICRCPLSMSLCVHARMFAVHVLRAFTEFLHVVREFMRAIPSRLAQRIESSLFPD